MTGPAASREACPACGMHTLALEKQPQIDVMGVQPFAETVGMGDLSSPPAIVCSSCGTRWMDLQAFRADRRDPPDAPGEDADR